MRGRHLIRGETPKSSLDILAVFLVLALIVGPAVALVIYGYRRGKRAFAEKLDLCGSAFQARWQSLATSFRVAIIPALFMLFGRFRQQATRDGEEAMGWGLSTMIVGLVIVFVIFPFVLGVLRAYRLHVRRSGSE